MKVLVNGGLNLSELRDPVVPGGWTRGAVDTVAALTGRGARVDSGPDEVE